MGTIEKGFMKGFKGLPGSAVSSKWKGKAEIKSRPPMEFIAITTQVSQICPAVLQK